VTHISSMIYLRRLYTYYAVYYAHAVRSSHLFGTSAASIIYRSHNAAKALRHSGQMEVFSPTRGGDCGG